MFLLVHVDAVSGEDEEKAKSIDGKTCPGNRSGIPAYSLHVEKLF